jgi:hypothetical protein
MKKAAIFLSAAALVATANVAYAAKPDFVGSARQAAAQVREQVKEKVSNQIAKQEGNRVSSVFRARMAPVQQLYFYEPMLEVDEEGRAVDHYVTWGKMMYHNRFERFIFGAKMLELETNYRLMVGETEVATGTTNDEGNLIIRGTIEAEVWETRSEEVLVTLVKADSEGEEGVTVLEERPFRIKQPKVEDDTMGDHTE